MRERDPDPYAVLRIPRLASRAEVARAYRSLAKRHHPDVPGGDADPMRRVNWAWYVLSDPARRSAWDAAHGGPAATHWTPDRRVRPTVRNERSAAGWTGWAEYRAEAMRAEPVSTGFSLGCVALLIVVALLMLFVLLAGLASSAPRNRDSIQTPPGATAAP